MKLNQENYEKLYNQIFLILIGFSAILILSFILLDKYLSPNNLVKLTRDNAKEKIKEDEKYLNAFLNKSQKSITLIRESKAFYNYLEKNKKDELIDLFGYIANEDKNIMQIRFIDKRGKEQIKINKDVIGSQAYIEDESILQNKEKRDYFVLSKEKPLEKVWFSNLDLNIENDKVEVPYKPVIRIILPISKNAEFNGILIINYFMSEFLNRFENIILYDSYIIDSKGYILVSSKKDLVWSKYRKNRFKIFDVNSNIDKKVLEEDFVQNQYYISKKYKFENFKNLIIVLGLSNKYIDEKKDDDFFSKSVIILTFIFITFILVWLVSKILKDLILKVTNYNEYIDLIDENIIISTTDIQGKITYVSRAFCEISGFDEKELLGKTHNVVKHPEENIKKYKQLWNNLINNKSWEGEFKNINKKGETYWVRAKIYPRFNEGNKIGYTAIRQNITDKKIIEKLSITDGLTKVYNRTFFIEIMPKVINSAKRDSKYLTFIMIDIDFFKQYNDNYGHKKGDEALQKVAQCLRKSLKRGNDYIFRMGGEEFAIVFLAEDYELSLAFCKKIKDEVENLNIEHKKNHVSKYLTISLGMVNVKAENIKNYEELYNDADKLLYEAKEDNRNIVKSKKF